MSAGTQPQGPPDTRPAISDRELLRLRSEALNRVARENEQLRAQIRRIRTLADEDMKADRAAWQLAYDHRQVLKGKIGSASCRERVSVRVELGGRRIVKKNLTISTASRSAQKQKKK